MEDIREVEELVEYFAGLGVPVSLVSVEHLEGGRVKARFAKAKESEREIRRILATGLSPLD